MFKLRYGYVITGIATGCIVLFSFLSENFDKNLHIVFCDVGQGDSIYIRFPDGRDMLVDGGPNNKVLSCLNNHMPFWDRHLNMVFLTHPQRDHLQGLIEVVRRFSVDYFIKSDVGHSSLGYRQLMATLYAKKIPIKFVTAGEEIRVGSTTLTILWPTTDQISAMGCERCNSLATPQGTSDVLATSAEDNRVNESINVNDASIVFLLRYGHFDSLFTGDADTRVESNYGLLPVADGILEILKYPHHGSRTAISDEFMTNLKPQATVISVGKNSYGHPNADKLSLLDRLGIQVLRTDLRGDIEIVSDGNTWSVH